MTLNNYRETVSMTAGDQNKDLILFEDNTSYAHTVGFILAMTTFRPLTTDGV
jgi:hypothetical protein